MTDEVRTQFSSPAEIKELTAFNRSFWHGTSSPMTADDVWLLLEQGYGLTDIGVMFGLSRERVRQVANTLGTARTIGTKPRTWDEQLGRFRAYEHQEWHERCVLRNRARRRITLQQRRAAKQAEQVRTLRTLHDELDRVPTILELAARCDLYPIELYTTWGYRMGKAAVSANQASGALYHAAGLQKRSRGASGHVDPVYQRSLDAETVRELWLSPHPYTGARKRSITNGTVNSILNQRCYKDITDALPRRVSTVKK